MQKLVFLPACFFLLLIAIIGCGGSSPAQSDIPPPPVRPVAKSPESESLMKRGHLSLEDSDWAKAAEFFDKALNIDPEYAPAYIGLLCAELKVRGEELLVDYAAPISEQNHFKRAVRFADATYKAKIEGFDKKIRERIKEQMKDAGKQMALKIKDVEYAFRFCPAGKFQMGEEGGHQVTLSKGFWMLETEVTQAMWESVMGNNPSDFKGAKLPVECVSWNGCQEFIKKLNDLKVAPAGFKFSLPTEAQWEYAVVVPARQAYSHCVSVGSENLKPAGATFKSFNFLMNS
jgi:tetratricopeptide (TPR) repeat protein